MYFVLGIVFVLLGLLLLIRPQLLYAAAESWKSSRSGEPSRLYRFSTRFGGAMLFLVGVLCFVVNFWPN